MRQIVHPVTIDAPPGQLPVIAVYEKLYAYFFSEGLFFLKLTILCNNNRQQFGYRVKRYKTTTSDDK